MKCHWNKYFCCSFPFRSIVRMQGFYVKLLCWFELHCYVTTAILCLFLVPMLTLTNVVLLSFALKFLWSSAITLNTWAFCWVCKRKDYSKRVISLSSELMSSSTIQVNHTSSFEVNALSELDVDFTTASSAWSASRSFMTSLTSHGLVCCTSSVYTSTVSWPL